MVKSTNNKLTGSNPPNQNELFDVVDINDDVIDQKSRHFVHQNNLLHRAVHALVFDGNNRLYLQKRSLTKDTNPGLWDTSMGGHLESGEGYDQAAIRETYEELGIVLESAPQRLFKLDACEDTGYEFIWIYKIVYSGEIVPCEIEISDGKWVGHNELTMWMTQRPEDFTSTLSLILEKYNQFDQ